VESSHFDIHAPLVERCLAGDRQAHYELYQRYSRAMLNTCFRMVGDRDAAEDILQDAFVSAFRNLSAYRGEATFGAWLKRIVVNKSLNYLQKQKSEWALRQALREEQEEAEPTEWELFDSQVDVERVRRAVGLLPEGYRLVFSLYLLEGYDHEEISEILGVSVSTSKSQLNRAKRKLLQLVGKEVSDGKQA
jgi:RNA polymerase sigma factor (sigma-70 family)